MATETVKDRATNERERPSGVPAPGNLGDARKEGLYLALSVALFLLIALSFWFEASH